ncbi:MAG: hypothetical protein NC305_12790 [Lachnospiraceae bacterium]|nr:hypothetical protein [Lachnospiraceae bacterium]
MGGILLASSTPTNGSVLAGVVTSAMLNGVLSEVVGVLPVCFPVMVSFIALRKGISFVGSILRSA